MDMGLKRRGWLLRLLAWCVHGYTALGLVAAAGMVWLLAGADQPGPTAFRAAFGLMLLATLIDATDGTLARAIRIKEVIPGLDGRRLDDIVDFLTYTTLPLFVIWRARLLPAGWEAILLLPLLASAYGFCQTEAKTADGYFLGFPSYWNLVAFYLYLLGLPPLANLTIVVGLALLTFVPSRYLYPSQRGRLNRITNLLGVPWLLMLMGILWGMGREDDEGLVRRLTFLSLYFPIFYMTASWLVTVRRWLRRRESGRLG
jgi:phosphatidylcholine synthase